MTSRQAKLKKSFMLQTGDSVKIYISQLIMNLCLDEIDMVEYCFDCSAARKHDKLESPFQTQEIDKNGRFCESETSSTVFSNFLKTCSLRNNGIVISDKEQNVTNL